jgi:hypothetical protein
MKTPGRMVNVSVAIQTGHLLNKSSLLDGRVKATGLSEVEFVAMYKVCLVLINIHINKT